ncbi:hypothetical protein J8273_0750 [Carpediemonas membranifera]|uniref:Uncharacterized protein n=1 Tax=Carpediemonas membranifera TaxID=201153 RepID=A0A8J6B3L8_9EUKA|nr:hypothetical protein J8273_0750 [Carpediemonas membranifera]|eukprot:KAG9397620.1 hypothetical protein J8273_0750 [Carpediemonas membranifera]
MKENNLQRYVTITSGDGYTFVVPLEVANLSETVRTMLLSGFREQGSVMLLPKTPDLNMTGKRLAGHLTRHPLGSAVVPESDTEPEALEYEVQESLTPLDPS